MNQPQFHPKARAEFERSAQFYNGKFFGLGVAFVIEVQAAVAFAFSHPEAGMLIPGGFRRTLVRRFPFSIIYRSKGERVYIIAVAHQRRHPEYWCDRG